MKNEYDEYGASAPEFVLTADEYTSPSEDLYVVKQSEDKNFCQSDKEKVSDIRKRKAKRFKWLQLVAGVVVTTTVATSFGIDILGKDALGKDAFYVLSYDDGIVKEDSKSEDRETQTSSNTSVGNLQTDDTSEITETYATWSYTMTLTTEVDGYTYKCNYDINDTMQRPSSDKSSLSVEYQDENGYWKKKVLWENTESPDGASVQVGAFTGEWGTVYYDAYLNRLFLDNVKVSEVLAVNMGAGFSVYTEGDSEISKRLLSTSKDGYDASLCILGFGKLSVGTAYGNTAQHTICISADNSPSTLYFIPTFALHAKSMNTAAYVSESTAEEPIQILGVTRTDGTETKNIKWLTDFDNEYVPYDEPAEEHVGRKTYLVYYSHTGQRNKGQNLFLEPRTED